MAMNHRTAEKLHALGDGAGNQGGGDDREGHLENDENRIRDGAIDTGHRQVIEEGQIGIAEQRGFALGKTPGYSR